MKTIRKLFRYQCLCYFKSFQYMMPFLALLLFQVFLYASAPVYLVDSFIFSAAAAFFLMIWLGMACNSFEETVSEQILILRIKSPAVYYSSQLLFLCFLGFIVTCISVAYPVICHLWNHMRLYTRPLRAGDIPGAFLLIMGAAFAGGAVGSFLHQRIVKERKAAVIMTALVGILSIAKGGIAAAVPAFCHVSWLFPPVYDFLAMFSDTDLFTAAKVLSAFGMLFLYGTALWIIKISLLLRNKF